MKKSFLAVLLVILVALIGYQMYQNKVQLRDGGQAKALIDIKGLNQPKAPKTIEPVFESASSTIELVKNAQGTNIAIAAYFTVKATAGAKNLNLPIGAQIDLVSITATPTTVMSTRVNSQSIPANIPAGTAGPLYFTVAFPASSTIPMIAGSYKAVLKDIYVNGATREAKFATNPLVIR